MNQDQPPTRPLPGEVPWVPAPVAPPLLWPRQMLDPGPAKWTQYKLKTHQLCTTCVLVLQDHQRRPFERVPGRPNPATKVRTVLLEDGSKRHTWHCAAHGEELQRRDEQATRQATAAREHAEHMARGRR